jgi:GntR family transcriptional regulator / MocR family aminotransferase
MTTTPNVGTTASRSAASRASAPDRVVYGGSASKTLAPGLRMGWLIVPAATVQRF